MQDDYSIPEHRRELYLSLVDTYYDPLFIADRLYFLDNHFPTQKLDIAIRWLIHSQFTGSKFVHWYKVVCKSSDLELHRVLISVVDNLKTAPLIAGHNFRI